MKATPEYLALEQVVSTCAIHEEALQDALSALAHLNIGKLDLEHLCKNERRLLDQFAYRYTCLQDDMRGRLIPSILRALGEDISAMPVIDILNQLEQLLWLPSADEWSDILPLKRLRFTNEHN